MGGSLKIYLLTKEETLRLNESRELEAREFAQSVVIPFLYTDTRI